MAEHTLQEMSDQAVKACRYFGKALEVNRRGWVGVEIDGVVFVAARAERAVALREQIELTPGLFGDGMKLSRAPGGNTVSEAAAPNHSPAEAREALGGAGEVDASAAAVVLVPLFHEPSEGVNYGHGGSVHLHVLNDATLGRRVRASGECLCSKKHGSNERMPTEDERSMCAECVKVAREHGIAWSLR